MRPLLGHAPAAGAPLASPPWDAFDAADPTTGASD